MQIYLSVTPEQERPASAWCRRFAHVAYCIGPGSTLLRAAPPPGCGGLLSLSDRDAPLVAAPERLAAAIFRECCRRGYTGVVADFEGSPTRDRRNLLIRLQKELSQRRWALYIPSSYSVEGAVKLVNTAVSGGDFQSYLHQSLSQSPCALDLQRLRMVFSLPAPTGEGTPLSAEEFQALAAGQSVFYSTALAERYFTCVRRGRTHFVLFDDADTLRRKLQLGRQAGARAAFLMYPEVQDLLPALFRQSP